LPLAVVLALFSTEILQLWTRNSEVAHNAGPIATVLVIGVALNGLMTLPYALQLAHGWTSLALGITISLIIVVVPALWIAAARYGPIGAAFVFMGLQALNMLIGLPLTHRRLLRHEMARWIFQDIAPPLAASALIAGMARTLITHPMSRLATAATLMAAFLVTLFAATSLAPQVRGSILAKLSDIY
jgi:O-antigen/teichoic acid export membrane protein